MTKKLILAALFATATLYADSVGGEISLGAYSHTPSGTASYTLPYVGLGTEADLEDTFGWQSNTDFMFKAYIEHPLPFIPNVKIGYTNLNHEGTGSSTNFTWGGIVGFSGDLESSLDMGMTDITAYYEILDSDLELDAGLTLRYLFGDIYVNPVAAVSTPVGSLSGSPLASETVSFSALAPMLYGKARFVIPSTDIALQLEANAISYDETTFYDYELGIRYTFAFGLGIEGGYKALHLDSTTLEDGLILDIDSDGFYASVVWDF